jgi:hypothetical protein
MHLAVGSQREEKGDDEMIEHGWRRLPQRHTLSASIFVSFVMDVPQVHDVCVTGLDHTFIMYSIYME